MDGTGTEDQKRDELKIDSDDLPPTQYLVLEVLAARHRTDEQIWTFPSRLRGALRELSYLGLVEWKGGIVENTVLAWLTDAGRSAALMDCYETPIDKALAAERRAGREDAARAVDEALKACEDEAAETYARRKAQGIDDQAREWAVRSRTWKSARRAARDAVDQPGVQPTEEQPDE